ncbi:hypothetical protein [Fluviispira sanaruensis]|uniref:Uncharacterized protein n=1 Tax=Fluviispira sanaruensis TaxID=2493639 RepID=A0A4P2VHP0_FLUSA|nr:hypothetical protein [Fluviispira sanaruensis]BBH52513.1 hypothetical protein JCM31447_09540 [Fluviispira sanaruensis]
MANFISEQQIVNEEYFIDNYIFSKLNEKYADIDYKTVMGSLNEIQNVFGGNDNWASASLTYADNLISIKRHEKEFDEKKSFTFCILSKNSREYLGCIYIKPIKVKTDLDLRKLYYDAQILFWTVAKNNISIDDEVYKNILHFIKNEWSFKRVAYPGRNISWENWENMKIGIYINDRDLCPHVGEYHGKE